MKYNDWEFEVVQVLLKVINGLEDRFSHVETQEGNHQSVFKNCLNKLVIFCQGSGIYHRVDDHVLQVFSEYFYHENFMPW